MPEKKIIKEGKRQRKGRKKLMPERNSIDGRKKKTEKKADHRWKENKKDERNSEKHEKSKKRA